MYYSNVIGLICICIIATVGLRSMGMTWLLLILIDLSSNELYVLASQLREDPLENDWHAAIKYTARGLCNKSEKYRSSWWCDLRLEWALQQ